MKIISTELPEVLILEPKVFMDNRGYFFESFQSSHYAQNGIKETFVQDNFSHSTKNVLRGLHYQLEEPQGKLVWVTRGSVFDVAVDVRYGSPRFGQWVGIILNDQNHWQLYIPPGFAHGFCVLSNTVDFVYKVTNYYNPQSEYGINWQDDYLNIEWPISNPILSEKDAMHPVIAALDPEKLPLYRPE